MANEELLKKLGESVELWNAWRKSNPSVKIDLGRANLEGANLHRADLSGADLEGANLRGANLRRANLRGANLRRANLRGANLRGANLVGANPLKAHLVGANLQRANVGGAHFAGADLEGADLTAAQSYYTSWVNLDLSEVEGLEEVAHYGPSSVGVDTLRTSRGVLPKSFLQGCGLLPWEILFARYFDPNLSAPELAELQNTIFQKRTDGPLYIGGVFISYSHDDSTFVDKVYGVLQDRGVSAWLDKHDMVAGDLQRQIGRALRLQDIVLLVLSESSVKSGWVKRELRAAGLKEADEGRDVLCPVALDASWKAKVDVDHLWRQLKEKVILDFSEWRTDEVFCPQFEKLLTGMKLHYAEGEQ